MKLLTESNKYEIQYEYEKVFLNLKNEKKSVYIGDFYGDPYTAIISKDEDFCVIAGEGAIIYYLREPFSDYDRSIEHPEQWMEWGRDEIQTVWIEQVEQIGNRTIRLVLETEEQVILDV